MESIARLLKELPPDYEQRAFEQGAITRLRGISSAADLMMLAMFHLHNGCSLIEMSEIARLSKLGEMSDVAFMKRFEKCADWFKAINTSLVSNGFISYEKPAWMEGKDVIGLDASDVSEKGRSGRIYRLHFALDIFNMKSIEHKITTNKTGETLTNFNPREGQLIIADRIYGSIKSIEHCERNNAEYILRLKKNAFTVRTKGGDVIDLASHLCALSENEYLDLSGFAKSSSGEMIPVRICAKKKDADSIEKTKQRIRRKESRNQYTVSDETKTFNEYIVVVTNVDGAASSEEILQAYRYRWQIEIYFKRLKSILDFGQLPKRREESVIAWLNGKLMIALLIEIIVAKASFSPIQNS